MKQLIACCGLDCENCAARIATVNNDDELREKTAKEWNIFRILRVARQPEGYPVEFPVVR